VFAIKAAAELEWSIHQELNSTPQASF
jgi:hypothetical protein